MDTFDLAPPWTTMISSTPMGRRWHLSIMQRYAWWVCCAILPLPSQRFSHWHLNFCTSPYALVVVVFLVPWIPAHVPWKIKPNGQIRWRLILSEQWLNEIQTLAELTGSENWEQVGACAYPCLIMSVQGWCGFQGQCCFIIWSNTPFSFSALYTFCCGLHCPACWIS